MDSLHKKVKIISSVGKVNVTFFLIVRVWEWQIEIMYLLDRLQIKVQAQTVNGCPTKNPVSSREHTSPIICIWTGKIDEVVQLPLYSPDLVFVN